MARGLTIAIAVLFGAPGCSSIFGLDSPTLAEEHPDSAMSSDSMCGFSTLIDTCKLQFGGDVNVTGTATFNTDTKLLSPALVTVVATDVVGPAGTMTVVAFSTFSIAQGATLRVIGSHPIAIFVDGSVAIGGTLDVANNGAGARTCDAVMGADDSSGAGGGGGGGFGAAGGKGGAGDSDGVGSVGGKEGAAQSRPTGPLGGCAGANGGKGGGGGNNMGMGGHGGGSVAISAAGQISVSGSILAGGGGGTGGGKAGGGGGGGSGGFILLESRTVTVDGTLAANGGGGGEGGDVGSMGAMGASGGSTTAAAAGGAGQASGGSEGGRGGSLNEPTGESVSGSPLDGGGGGGGAAGFIAIGPGSPSLGPTGSIISPAFVAWP